MRIIAGTFRGRQIRPPRGLPVRPTTDRTKEALFNMLMQRLDWEGLRVLDLFAGTGNISFECYSRGAARVVAVDQDWRCVAAIKAGLQILGLPVQDVVQQDVRRYVAQATGPFDLVFMDPPYAMPGQPELIAAIREGSLLAPEGLLVVEHASSVPLEALPGWTESRRYGDSTLSFFDPLPPA
ncbi:MAG: 16S rRNA (guanine(966)-N(2))-methyltransferase RsmD [Bacteroidetes bacterium]|nr:MAG: 16S rRNA (guanine(966)-N(2))-methyltransferase RsmD [Bacteroidota bacterium]